MGTSASAAVKQLRAAGFSQAQRMAGGMMTWDEQRLPGDEEMKTVTLYTTQWCPFCLRAKSLLASKGVEFDEIAVDGNPSLRAEMAAMAGRNKCPSDMDRRPIRRRMRRAV